MEVITVNHTWTIANSSFCILKKVVESLNFASEVNDGVEWNLRLYPKGIDDDSKGHIPLFLELKSCASEELVAKCKVSRVSKNPLFQIEFFPPKMAFQASVRRPP